MVVEREQWGSRVGFILAAVGGAVGFGNVVRFPSFVAESGGAAFVVVYLFLVLFVGIPTFLAEMSVGREGRGDAVTSFENLGGKAWSWAGALFVFAALFFMGYYIVLNGYVTLYLLDAIQFTEIADPVSRFGEVVTGPDTLIATFVTMALVVGVVALGVRDGLERAGLLLIPVLFALLMGLAVYGVFQDGATGGLAFFLEPEFGEINLQTLVDAAGQAFFSLGIGIGFVVTYGSYLDRDSDMTEDSLWIASGDTLVALIAGFMVFPLLFSAGLQDAVTAEGVNPFSVLFVTLPATFATIGGTLGVVLQFLFFLALFFAVISSSIAATAVPVAWIEERFEIPRWKATVLAAEVIMIPAVLAAFSSEALTQMDRFVSTIALPLGGLVAVLFAGYQLPDPEAAVDRGARFPVGKFLRIWWRTALPVILVIVLVSGLTVFFN